MEISGMIPSEFLKMLWGDTPAGWALIWTLPNKRSTWFSSFHAVDRWVEAYRSEWDIYTGVSIAGASQCPPPSNVRTASVQSAGIPGLWADIDIAGPAHQKSGLPPDANAAMMALKCVGYEPSIIVHSGYGLQCWWLFHKPWIFADEHEKRVAQQLAWSWHDLVSGAFGKHGYSVDATHDLARVMRLPGTRNHKLGTPAQVKVIQTSDFRWRSLPDLPAPRKIAPSFSESTPMEIAGTLELHSDAQLSSTKAAILQALQQNISAFAATWEGNRRFKDGDDSPSAYDMSIAHWCAAAGFTDQEIAAAIITWRRVNGHDMAKALRQDYMQRTIGKVRSGDGMQIRRQNGNL